LRERKIRRSRFIKHPATGAPLNKNELAEALARKTDLSHAAAGRAIDALIETLTGSLAKGESIQLVGFGSFGVAKRKAREGRNPRTGLPIRIAAAKVPKFSAGSKLKAAVNRR
jgi:DNA-binding protein HU-beta